jgi:Subtilase family
MNNMPLKMKACRQGRWVWLVLTVVLCLCRPGLAAGVADRLVWHKQPDRMDADVQSWNVRQLLEQVASATGWEIYLDPGAVHPVSAKFSNLPTSEALHSLLGNVNFLLAPQTNGPTRLYVFRTSQRQATSLIVAPAKKAVQPVPNELVVTLKPGSKTKIDDLARSLGAKVIGRMDGQNTYLLQFDDDAATQAARAQLAANPDVASVDVNYPVDRPPTADLAQGTSPDLQLKPTTNNNGDCPLVVGLIDTPVQSLSSNLSQFFKPAISVMGASQSSTTPAASGKSMAVSIQPLSLQTGAGAAQPTHGTAMAETILDALQSKTGGSTSVKILPVDVYGNSETTTTFDVANGIVQAVNNGANILNLSLGSTGDSQLLHNVITQVSQQGIPIYAAAGNEPVTTPTYPAAYPEVVAVTASDSSGNIAPYANRGSFVKIIAPGDNVIGYDGQNYLVEGTSTSTAFISGTAAGLGDAAHACPDAIQALLQKSATPAPALNH